MEANLELFFKMSKNIYRETETQVDVAKVKEEKYEQMSVHTFNALQEIKKKDLVSEAKKEGTVEELENFYKDKFKDHKYRLHKEIEFKRLYEEIRKLKNININCEKI